MNHNTCDIVNPISWSSSHQELHDSKFVMALFSFRRWSFLKPESSGTSAAHQGGKEDLERGWDSPISSNLKGVRPYFSNPGSEHIDQWPEVTLGPKDCWAASPFTNFWLIIAVKRSNTNSINVKFPLSFWNSFGNNETYYSLCKQFLKLNSQPYNWEEC